MAKILVADDELSIRTMVCEYLTRMGHEVVQAKDGPSVLTLLETQSPDLLLLDVMMPGLDGFTLAKQLLHKTDIPLLFMTARSEEADKVLGLELGADDYITKPFSLREMTARIQAVLRRTGRNRADAGNPGKEKLVWKDIELDMETYRVKKSGEILSLSALQFQILQLMLQSPGRVFTRAQILEAASHSQLEAYERTVDVHMKNLRKILGDDVEAPKYIETVRGVGYRLAGK